MMSAQLQKSEATSNHSKNAPSSLSQTAAATAFSVGPAPPAQSTGAASSMRNRAGDSTSPFIRAHVDTLVSWQLLDDEAVERARRENKLIFMTIGYLASHSRQDSFSNPTIASILNEYFVPIVVDREERPDIDNIYMNYNHSLNNGGGWPLNLFLTPELEPVFGGTYWVGPGVRQEAGTGGADEPLEFLVILRKLQDVWPAEEPRVRQEAKKSVIDLRQYSGEGTLSGDEPDEVDLDQIEEAYNRIGGTFDPMFGGFGQGPKFPTTAKLSFLLRATRFPSEVQDVVGSHDCEFVSTMALHTLRRMVLGGMHDHIGGGFHRHSVTRDWWLPTFEKMVADNSLLLGLYLDAWLLLGGQKGGEFAGTVLEIADYLTSKPIMLEAGGFITSEAADSYHRRGDKVKRQGAYYLWSRKEFDMVIGNERESQVAAAHWDVQEHGNVDPAHDPHDEFLNQNVLRVVRNEARLAKQFGVPERGVRNLVESAKRKLRAHRLRERPQPDLDAKVVAAYNGMAVAALARTAAALSHADDDGLRERARHYLRAAERAALFVRAHLWDDGTQTLYRAFSGGRRADIEGFAEDYAFLVEGLLELYEATADASWLRWAARLQDRQLALFYDEQQQRQGGGEQQQQQRSGTGAEANNNSNNSNSNNSQPHQLVHQARCGAFYSTRPDAPHAILRIKDAMDSAQPSANAVSASNLFRLAALLPHHLPPEPSSSSSHAPSPSASAPHPPPPDAAAAAAAAQKRYAAAARQTVRAFGVEMLEHPHLFPGLLCGVVPLKLGGRHWVLVSGGNAQDDREVRRAFHKAPRAGLFTLAFAKAGEGNSMEGVDGPGAYVLEKEGGRCRRLRDEDLREVLGRD
ncbi:hypothetical protein DL765_001552 [Monosporascus sp. GIB2]|nr:hypothetical protein DL765_001552 [Monosporascus sp. GIB2]